MRRKIGLGLLYVAGSLVIAGSMYDLFVPTLPPNLLAYQGVTPATIDPRVAALDLGLLRALGGCLLAIGATALVLVHGPIRRGERWAMLARSAVFSTVTLGASTVMLAVEGAMVGSLVAVTSASLGSVLW